MADKTLGRIIELIGGADGPELRRAAVVVAGEVGDGKNGSLVNALLASFDAPEPALCHAAFEATIWPQSTGEWLAVVALGIGPVGIAFYAWDVGVKRGDIRLLGVASYAAPLLSTFFLVLAGYAEASLTLWFSALLIAGGGLLAAKDMLGKTTPP